MNWSKQTDTPLFPEILWSRPENRRHAGKLLVIGGHSQSFSAVSDAYAATAKAGAGTVRVIVPDKLRPMLTTLFPEAEYAASTEIGSFGRQALADMLDTAEWADGVLLAGDFGKNSETAVLLENFAIRYKGLLIMAGDSIDYFIGGPGQKLSARDNTIVSADPARLQKLASPHLIQQNADFMRFIEQISGWTAACALGAVTWHSDKLIAAYKSGLSSTAVKDINEPALAAHVSVWLMQQPGKTFEALTSAAWCYTQP